jgi:hypothetical protein
MVAVYDAIKSPVAKVISIRSNAVFIDGIAQVESELTTIDDSSKGIAAGI